MTGGPLLQANSVVAGYGIPVVGPFSISIAPGEIIGLSGPNGSGKSTLLKAIGNGARIFSGQLERRPGLTLAWQQQQAVGLIPAAIGDGRYHFYTK